MQTSENQGDGQEALKENRNQRCKINAKHRIFTMLNEVYYIKHSFPLLHYYILFLNARVKSFQGITPYHFIRSIPTSSTVTDK